MKYTDEQLQQALAGMLLGDIYFDKRGVYRWTDRITPRITPHEWLRACHLVESSLSAADKMQYAELLADGTDVVDWGYYPGEASIDWDAVATIAIATWQQRALALAKLKGVKIL